MVNKEKQHDLAGRIKDDLLVWMAHHSPSQRSHWVMWRPAGLQETAALSPPAPVWWLKLEIQTAASQQMTEVWNKEQRGKGFEASSPADEAHPPPHHPRLPPPHHSLQAPPFPAPPHLNLPHLDSVCWDGCSRLVELPDKSAHLLCQIMQSLIGSRELWLQRQHVGRKGTGPEEDVSPAGSSPVWLLVVSADAPSPPPASPQQDWAVDTRLSCPPQKSSTVDKNTNQWIHWGNVIWVGIFAFMCCGELYEGRKNLMETTFNQCKKAQKRQIKLKINC